MLSASEYAEMCDRDIGAEQGRAAIAHALLALAAAVREAARERKARARVDEQGEVVW